MELKNSPKGKESETMEKVIAELTANTVHPADGWQKGSLGRVLWCLLEIPLLGLWMALFSLCLPMVYPPCTSVFLSSSSYKGTSHLESGPTLMATF